MIETLRDRRLLVLGANGFIGRHVVQKARALGAEVLALGHKEADVTNRAALIVRLAEAKPELVVHAAGIANWSAKIALDVYISTHEAGTTNVVDACRAARVKHLVAVGSAGEYGDGNGTPLTESAPSKGRDPYSLTKASATAIVSAADFPATVVRPFQVYGPGEPETRLLPSLFKQAHAGGGPFATTAGQQVRDFVFVEDVAEGILRAAANVPNGFRLLNLGTGIASTVRQAVTEAANLCGNIEPQFGALPYREGEPRHLVASVVELERTLGWRPGTSLSNGLERSWRQSFSL